MQTGPAGHPGNEALFEGKPQSLSPLGATALPIPRWLSEAARGRRTAPGIEEAPWEVVSSRLTGRDVRPGSRAGAAAWVPRAAGVSHGTCS